MLLFAAIKTSWTQLAFVDRKMLSEVVRYAEVRRSKPRVGFGGSGKLTGAGRTGVLLADPQGAITP